MKTTDKQQGLSLLETLLVLVISTTIILAGFKVYNNFKTRQNLTNVKYTATQLMSATGKYYFSVCMTDPSNAGGQYPIDKANMKAAADDGINIEEDLQKYLPDNEDNTFVNPFGNFLDGDPFKASLMTKPVEEYNGDTDEMTYQGRVFDSDVLWKAQIQMCDTRYAGQEEELDEDALNAIKTAYLADDAEVNADICDGVVVSWQRFPRSVAIRKSTGSSMATQGSNSRFNKMYQWNASMKGHYNDDRLNYLCQN